MIIHLNGKPQEFDEPLNIAELIELIDVRVSLFVVEHNQNIINKDSYDKIQLKDQDKV
ncbi:MAG: sulfur carrier protein ThiS [Vampirovibrionia bacterium]